MRSDLGRKVISMGISINLDGKPKGDGENSFQKVHVSDDVHEGTIKELVVMPAKDFDSGADVKKIVLNVALPEGVVSSWNTPKVTKGSGTYSSSNLYTVLEKAKLIEDFKQFTETIVSEEQLALYFNEKLKGKKIKVLTKTVKPKDGSEPYSKIDKIISID